MRLAFVVGCALMAGTARGQGAGPPRPDPAAPPARAQTTQPTPSGGAAQESDRLEAAADNVARMKAALKLVLGRAEQARNEKDVVKLNCINEKLTQMKALLKVAEQADVALRESMTLRRSGEVEFSKVAIARTKADALRRAAEQCIGQLAYMIDENTSVDVEQPSNLPGSGHDGLGVANREENPADSVTDIGVDTAADGNAPCVGRGTPFCPPPVVRPPPASAFR